mgnify:CR=1 FL=1
MSGRCQHQVELPKPALSLGNGRKKKCFSGSFLVETAAIPTPFGSKKFNEGPYFASSALPRPFFGWLGPEKYLFVLRIVITYFNRANLYFFFENLEKAVFFKHR